MNGSVTPDPSGSLPGRGGWVHPTRECIDKAITRKAFGRALKVSTLLNTELIATVGVSSETPTVNNVGFHPGIPNEQAD